MIKKYVDELIDICKKIDFEYDKLIELSEKNLEKTEDYENHLSLVGSYLQVAIEYCYKFSIKDLGNVLNCIHKLIRNDPDAFGFSTSSKIVSYVLEKKYIANRDLSCSVDKENDYIDDEENDYVDDEGYTDRVVIVEEAFDEDIVEGIYEQEDLGMEDYPEELDDFYDDAMSIIYVRASRNLIRQLLDMEVHNEDEKRYRAQLIALYQTRFKYDFLSSSVSLELISIKAHFNPFKMFFTSDMDFRAIYFNEILNIIRVFYERDCDNVSQEDILEDYFTILCIIEMLDCLDHDRLLKLRDACNMLDGRVSLDEYNEICLRKIRERLDLS